MTCEEMLELITAMIDGELSASERRLVESHLNDCPACRITHAQEESLKTRIQKATANVTAPADLRQRLLSAHGIFHRRRGLEKWLFSPARLLPRPAFVFAVLLLLVLPWLHLSGPKRRPVTLAALNVHEQILSGAVSVSEQSEEELKARLIRSVTERFAPMGYDLSAIGLRPFGGFTEELDGKRVLVVLYRGDGLALSCFTFLGSEDDAPATTTPFFDPEKRMNFYSFSRGRINGVMHREGEIICILVSEMPAQDLLTLARSKAHSS